MVHSTTTSDFDRRNYPNQKALDFNRYYFNKSKPLLVAMGLALIYCAIYGFILVHEFRKMGILDIVWSSK